MKKGRNNKLNLGDQIEFTRENVKYYVEHLNNFFLVPGDKEVRPQDYATIAGFYHAILTDTPPKGEVVGFTGTDCGPKPWNSKGRWIDYKEKRLIRIRMKLKYSIYDTLCSERHVKKI